jgi:Fe-S-cluster containining protein
MCEDQKAACECDCCGACCSGALLVEAYELDGLREPRLLEADVGGWKPTIDDLADETRCVLLAGGHPCQCLGADHRCSIYPTRPNVCVGMRAGDEQCQEARSQKGLPPLEPSSVMSR